MYQTFYSLQTKFAKVMFLHVSVFPQGGGIPACLTGGIPACLAGLQGSVSFHRGVVSQHASQVVSQHALQVSRGVCIPACLAGFQAHTQGGAWGVWLRGVSRPTPRGGCPSMHWGRPPPADSYCYILLECILVINCSHKMFFTYKIYCTQAK